MEIQKNVKKKGPLNHQSFENNSKRSLLQYEETKPITLKSITKHRNLIEIKNA